MDEINMIFPLPLAPRDSYENFFFEIGTFLNSLPTVVLGAVTTTELQFRIVQHDFSDDGHQKRKSSSLSRF